MTDRLAGVQAKIARADQHVHDLEDRVKAFFSKHPYKVAAKRDPKTRRPVYYLAGVEDVPPDIALIVGDVI